jgi:hypothetical protein
VGGIMEEYTQLILHVFSTIYISCGIDVSRVDDVLHCSKNKVYSSQCALHMMCTAHDVYCT